MGGLDILVCNASAFAHGAGEDAFRAAFDVDLMHTRNACEAALPWLERSGAGSIIAISSISGSEDYGYDSVSYGTMKAALFFYVKSLARHVAAKGVRANVVSPGTTLFDGGFWDRVRLSDPKSFEEWLRSEPESLPFEDASLDAVVADPAGAARSAQTGIADLDLVALAPPRGLGILPRVERDPERRDIVSGCTRVNLALERGALTVERAMYEAGLRAPATKRTLARAMTGYRWDERQPGRPSKDGTHDHHADTLRYAVREVLWYLPDESRREPPKPEQPRRHVQHDPMDMR